MAVISTNLITRNAPRHLISKFNTSRKSSISMYQLVIRESLVEIGLLPIKNQVKTAALIEIAIWDQHEFTNSQKR